MGWNVPTTSGKRYRGGFRDPDGHKHQLTFDYPYEADRFWQTAEDAITLAQTEGRDWQPAVGACCGCGRCRALLGAAAIAAIPPHDPAPATEVRKPTVAEWAEDYLQRARGRIAPNTLTNYDNHIRKITAAPFAGLPLDQVETADIERWRTQLRAAGETAGWINGRVETLRRMYADAARRRGMAGLWNPTDGLEPLTRDIFPERILSPAEERRLLLASDGWLSAQILLGLYSGLRWGEIAGLFADCLEDGEVVVWQQYDRKLKDYKPLTKSGKPRRVPVIPRVADALQPFAGPAGRRMFVPASSADPYGHFDGRWHHAKRAAELSEVPRPLRFHDLRHTFATRLNHSPKVSVPRSVIKDLLGHADEATTAKYIHAMPDTHKDLVLGAFG